MFNANLELAVGKAVANGGILITHSRLAHRDMEIVTYMSHRLILPRTGLRCW